MMLPKLGFHVLLIRSSELFPSDENVFTSVSFPTPPHQLLKCDCNLNCHKLLFAKMYFHYVQMYFHYVFPLGFKYIFLNDLCETIFSKAVSPACLSFYCHINTS